MFGTFPYEPEPDGAVFGPHHFYLGVLLILLVCWMVYDPESDGRPWVVAGTTLLAVFAFALTWPYYPIVGAAGVLVLLAVATVSALIRPFWWRSGVVAHGSVLAGLLVAWDDGLSHALGWRTPLDALWVEYLHPYASDPYVPSEFRLPSELQLPTDVDLSSDRHLPTDLRTFADRSIAELERLLADGEALVLQQVADAIAVVAL